MSAEKLQDVYGKRFANHLLRFLNNPEKMELAVSLSEQGIEKPELFRQVSSGLGVPKPHCSFRDDGDLKGT